MVVHHHVDTGTRSGSSGRAASALNISPVLFCSHLFLGIWLMIYCKENRLFSVIFQGLFMEWTPRSQYLDFSKEHWLRDLYSQYYSSDIWCLLDDSVWKSSCSPIMQTWVHVLSTQVKSLSVSALRIIKSKYRPTVWWSIRYLDNV